MRLSKTSGWKADDPADRPCRFYRRRAVKQELVLKAARKEFATISQGLPPPTRPKMTVRVPPMPPLQEVEEQSQVERSSRETQAETGELLEYRQTVSEQCLGFELSGQS